MNKLYLLLFFIGFILFDAVAQTGKEFWFAAPEVTSAHNDRPIMLRLATSDSAGTVTVSMPANPSFVPITVNMPANSSQTIDLTPFIDIIENKPANTVLNNGLFIKSSQNITAYYEVNNSNNNEFFSLKGESALGTEFYTPFQKFFENANFNPMAYAAFDIVATEDNTTILIYPKTNIVGHNALTSFTIILNKGQTWSGANPTTLSSNNPSGTIITSDKPIAVTVKSDSDANPLGSCLDLEGDQIVPTDIIGKEYIAVNSNVDNERVFILAIDNNTVVNINGTYKATLFGAETLDQPLTTPFTYITASKPIYVYHLSGFGCELGAAILPPLNCAGSQQISFVRSTSEFFGLNLLIKNGAQAGFTLNGNSSLIKASDFTVVPGTSGAWVAARISFNTTDIPVGSANLISNSISIFSMGMINGGATSGARFGYFSEFKAPIKVDAGLDQFVCANNVVNLDGSVKGGASTGIWSTNGSGTFITSNTTLKAIYKPSVSDISAGNITFTLKSTSICFPEEDQVKITFTPAPTADAGVDPSVCANKPKVALNGKVTISTGGIWSGGKGTFSPNNLIASYTPTAQEITDGKVVLTLTTTGNGNCLEVKDSIELKITPAPTAIAGTDQSICSNNPLVQLNGSITVATGGIWSGGAGKYNSSETVLNATYLPTPSEISAGTLFLKFKTTGNGDCLADSALMKITFTPSPIAKAGTPTSICANKADITLNGSVTLPATGLIWSGGMGSFTPSNTTANAVYTPTTAELQAGNVQLILRSTGNGNCKADSSKITFPFTPAPTINAGADIFVCENSPAAQLNGNGLSNASGAIWSGGMGSFDPGPTSLKAIYTPHPSEITKGSVTLTLATTGYGNCNAVTDDVKITISPKPVVFAGNDAFTCNNNPSLVLTGTVQNAGGISWSGAGTFLPNKTTANPTYTPSVAEINSGVAIVTLTSTDNGNCNAVADDIKITITPSPTANAGNDQVICENNANIQLDGKVTIASGGLWTGGDGSFLSENTTLNAIYTPTTAEINSGSVTLILNSTDNGTCNAVSDFVKISFTPAPVVNAGSDQNVCANNAKVVLKASVSIATGGVWSGGGGSFSPDINSPNASYFPTPEEILAGVSNLIYTSTGNGKCTSVTDQVTLIIAPSPLVNAGNDMSSCINNPSVSLDGSILNAGGGIWTGGTGIFSTNPSDLKATYIPSQTEINSGFVNLTLNSTNNGNCIQEADEIKITINPSPLVNAGPDVSVCGNNADVKLNGSIINATGGIWSGGQGVFSPDNNSLTGIYTPTSSEILKGTLTLTLNSSGNGNCKSVNDDMVIQFTSAPSVSTGGDQTVCANNSMVQLNGTANIASGGIWSGGSGSFNPSVTDSKATYIPTPAEIEAGTLFLTFTSTGNGNCKAVSEISEIIITPAANVSAGQDQNICVDKKDVVLNGFISGKTNTGIWTTSGNGFFTPGNTILNGSYRITAADSVKGKVTLILTSTNNGNCRAVADSIQIFILPAGSVDAGSDQSVCANNAVINLSGKISGGATSGIWSSSGKGTFLPDNKNLNAKYLPSKIDSLSGQVTLTLTANSCSNSSDDLQITIYPAALPDAGVDKIVCASDLKIPLNGKINGTPSTGSWMTNGSGSFIPNNTTLDAIYQASKGDSLNKNVVLTLLTPGSNNCKSEVDTLHIRITSAGTSNAGADQSLCENNAEVQLDGSVGGGADAGIWSSSGTGQFTPSRVDFNAKYIPSGADLSSGNITLTFIGNSCDKASDEMVINFTKTPTIDAGKDQSICANNPTVFLSGSIQGSSNGLWISAGSGVFAPSNSGTNVSYQPSSDELSKSEIYLWYSSTVNGNCKPVKDSVLITIVPKPTVNAGIDMSVCKSVKSTALFGIVESEQGTGSWKTLGSGIFLPNANVTDASYIYGSSDTLLGYAKLVLTSTNNGNCKAESDTVTINFGNTVFVNAGPDVTICSTEKSVPLEGLVSGGSEEGTWESAGSGSFFPTAKELSSFYKIGSGDADKGLVRFILTSTNNGKCKAGKDTMNVKFIAPGKIYAGVDKDLCKGTKSILLYDAASESPIQWKTSGSGFFLNNLNKNTEYAFSKADSMKGNITLTIESRDEVCDVSDEVQITFGGKSFADAGTDQAICGNSSSVLLKGYITGEANGGKWTSLGTGKFLGSENSLENTYQLSKADSLNSSVKIVLSSLPKGGCAMDTDTLEVTVQPIATMFAGVDTTICNGISQVKLNGVASSPVSFKWTTSGNGTFYPNDTVKSPEYILGREDSIAKKVNIYLSALNQKMCQPLPDTSTIVIKNITKPVFSISNLCADQYVVFKDTTKLEIDEHRTWNFGDNTTSILQNPQHLYGNIKDYFAVLTITSEAGCKDSLSKIVSLKASPKAGFKITTDVLKVSTEIGFADLSEGSNFWKWTFGDESDTVTLQQPSHTFLKEGTYNILQIVNNEFNCSDTAVVEVFIKGNIVLPPKLPNAFSPNGDGNNDIFIVRGGPFLDVDFRIYNVWGELIFETKNPLEGWDGNYNGIKQALGVYIYTINAVTQDGKKYSRSGDVTLIK